MLTWNNTNLKAENVLIVEEVNGERRLSFDLAYTDADAESIAEYDIITETYYADQQFFVEKKEKVKAADAVYRFECRHVYFMAESCFIDDFAHRNGVSAADIFEDIWSGVSGFAVLTAAQIVALGMTPVTTLTDFDDKSKTNPIKLTEDLIKAVGQGEVYIDNKTVALVEDVGEAHNRLTVALTANSDSISITKDVSGLITRLYAFGRDDLTMEDEIGAVYIDSPNISTYGQKDGYIDFPEISDPEMLCDRAEWQFDSGNPSRLDVPYITIDCKFIDLSPIDINVDMPYLGQAVSVEGYTDKRIVKIGRRPLEPYNTDITIGQIKKDLFFYLKRFNNAAADVESGNINVSNNPHTVTQITEITKQEVVAADIIEATAAFIDDLQIERLETNLKNYICLPNITIVNDVPEWDDEPHTWHAKTGYTGATVRGYIKLFEMSQQFIEAQLVTPADSSAIVAGELEAVQINGRQLYFTSIAGANAFEYFTFTAPTAKYPQMSADVAAMYVVYKRKSSAEYIKMQQVFTWSSADNTYFVDTIYGTGDAQGRGVYKFAKDANSGKLIYTSRTSGAEIGIKIVDDGVYYTQDGVSWHLIGEGGGADSSIGKVKIIDGAITSSDVEDGYNIYMAYDTSENPYVPSGDPLSGVQLMPVVPDANGHGTFILREIPVPPITPLEIHPDPTTSEILFMTSYENNAEVVEFEAYIDDYPGESVTWSVSGVSGLTAGSYDDSNGYVNIPADMTTSGTVTVTATGTVNPQLVGSVTIPFINAKPTIVGLSNVTVTHREPSGYGPDEPTTNTYSATFTVTCDLLAYYTAEDIGVYFTVYQTGGYIDSISQWNVNGTTGTCTIVFTCSDISPYQRAIGLTATGYLYQIGGFTSDPEIFSNLPD